MPRLSTEQPKSKRTGKFSNVDKQGQNYEDSEDKPLSSRASRAAKSALLENPPWAALKPKSRQKTGTSVTSNKRKCPSPTADARRPKNKKLKQAPIPSHVPSRRSSTQISQRLTRKFAHHRAPSINVEESDDAADGNFNEEGEDDGGKQSDDHEDSLSTKSDQSDNEVSPELLKAEEAKIVGKQRLQKPARVHDLFRSRSVASSSGFSTRASDPPPSGPPTSDVDDELDELRAMGDSGQVSKHSRMMTHRELKLKQERPIVHARLSPNNPTPSPQSSRIVKKEESSTVHGNSDLAATEDLDSKPWKPRTNLTIFMKSKKTAAIGLKNQNSDIRKVIHASYEHGKLALIVGDPEALLEMPNDDVVKMSSPFGTRGLEDIGLLALIKAADSNGYNGEYDIAHRLEEGSESLYIEPLQDYVAHRLSLFRSNFKKSIALVAPSVLGMPTNSHKHNTSLLNSDSFIYPWSLETGFDMSKPFQNVVIAKSVDCAFFTPGTQYNSLGLEFAGRLTLSSDAQPGQREVSIYMVALASVAVASIIQDTLLNRTTDFAGPQLDSMFKKFVVILLSLRRYKPNTYHRIMHNIYMTAIGEKATNLMSADLTADEILGKINWDLIDE